MDCNIQIQCAGLYYHSPGQELQKKTRLLKTELQKNKTFIEKNSFLEAPAARRGPRKSSRLTLSGGPPYSPAKFLNVVRTRLSLIFWSRSVRIESLGSFIDTDSVEVKSAKKKVAMRISGVATGRTGRDESRSRVAMWRDRDLKSGLIPSKSGKTLN